MKMRYSALILTAMLGALAQPAWSASAGEAASGKRVFLRCMACHSVENGAPAKVGPNLRGVVGRKAAAAPGFRYSAAITNASLRWDDATLDKWLTRPASLVPGTSMVFAGLPNPDERKAVIAYLKQPVQ